MNFYVLLRWMAASQPFLAETRVRTQVRIGEIFGGQSGTLKGLSPSTSVFPCQYHSTNAPYPFIHLPPTPYNIFLPVFQFSPVSTIPPMLHTHLHFSTSVIRRTSGRRFGTMKQSNAFFTYRGDRHRKVVSHWFLRLDGAKSFGRSPTLGGVSRTEDGQECGTRLSSASSFAYKWPSIFSEN